MSDTTDPVGQIPSPSEVRARLAANLREAKLLRSLLRVSRSAEVARRQSPPRAEASSDA